MDTCRISQSTEQKYKYGQDNPQMPREPSSNGVCLYRLLICCAQTRGRVAIPPDIKAVDDISSNGGRTNTFVGYDGRPESAGWYWGGE
jgi:hypothetical protein